MDKNIRQLLDELGYDSRDYDKDVKGALEELIRARHEREFGTLHGTPDDCPTYHDGCHCTAENLLILYTQAEKDRDNLADDNWHLRKKNERYAEALKGSHLL